MSTKVEVGQVWTTGLWTTGLTEKYGVVAINPGNSFVQAKADLRELSTGAEVWMVLALDGSPHFHMNWTLVAGPGYIDQIRIEASLSTEYGAICTKCNTFNEYAEASPTFICYGCKS